MDEKILAADDLPAAIATIVMFCAVAVAGFNIQPMYPGAPAVYLGFSAGQLELIAGAEIGGSALAGIAATQWIRRREWRRAALIALTVERARRAIKLIGEER